MMAVANFFEDIGIMAKSRSWSIKEAKDRFGGPVTHYYGLLKDNIKAQQETDPEFLKNFKDLATKISEEES